MIRLYDTAMARVAALEPRRDGEVSMYVCGPTVYDVPHVGHGRAALVYDVLRRYLEWAGRRVVHVSNITDVDDKIIERANRERRDPTDVAAEYEQAWYEALRRLDVHRPHHDPHATDYVDHMVALVAGLVEAGRAYETTDGVYLAVETVDDYGLLKHQSLDTLMAGARVDVNEEKRWPLDFALWKLAKPGEPSWASPWGAGRPGWHTECVVMSLDLLGEGFDLHAGGMDLIFPHHENERAQAVAAGKGFARRWMHHAFVERGGVKMAKSLGNYTSLTDLLASTDGRVYRMLVLQSHYRKPVEVTPATVDAAARTLATLDDFVRRTADLPGAAADAAVMERFRRAMDDDLDTPKVIADVSDVRRRANALVDAGNAREAAPLVAAVNEIATALGLTLGGRPDDIDEATAAKVSRRDQARARRDFAAADALRDELVAAGWTVEDTPRGTRIHR